MGKYVPFAIGESAKGLVKNRNSYVIAESAYQDLFNATVWRGRVKRKHGLVLLDRLGRNVTLAQANTPGGSNLVTSADLLSAERAAAPIAEPDAEINPTSVVVTIDAGGANETIATDDGTGRGWTITGAGPTAIRPNATITDISTAANAVVTTAAAHGLNNGDQIIIDGVVGFTDATETLNDRVLTVANAGAMDFQIGIDTSLWGTWSSGGTVYPSWVNYITGALNLNFASNLGGGLTVSAALRYYPSLPVMGIHRRELTEINAEETLAWDRKYSYQYVGGADQWQQFGTATWTGDDTNYFSALNYYNPTGGNPYVWATNFNLGGGDPIRYYDTVWNTFQPAVDGAGNLLRQCRLLVAYRGRMVALFTEEDTAGGAAGYPTYPQRARFSQVGDPTQVDAWRQDTPGKGGFIDCPTGEQIVSAEFIRDTLIVAFERSTWALRYSGNEIQPFYWDRINKELGGESTFAVIAFDQGVMNIGERSVNMCDGNSVRTVDDDIPDQIFEIHNGSDGPKRVHGIRDYYNRMVYWTYPNADNDEKWPDRILAFNYEQQTWSVYDDQVSVFGYWQDDEDLTWATVKAPTWSTWDTPWDSGNLQSDFVHVISGNQHGFTHKFDPIRGETSAAQAQMHISDITYNSGEYVLEIKTHGLTNDDWIRISGIVGWGSELNDNTYNVIVSNSNTLRIQDINGLQPPALSNGTYQGNGKIARRQNFRIVSKDFNQIDKGSKNFLGYIDFLMDKTTAGEVTCQIYTDYNATQPVNDGTDSFYNTIVPTSASQFSGGGREKEWQRLFCTVDAQFWHFELTLSDAQLVNEDISTADVDLNAVVIYSEKGSRLTD